MRPSSTKSSPSSGSITLLSASVTSSSSTIPSILVRPGPVRTERYAIGSRSIVTYDEQRAILRISGDEDRASSGRRRRPLSTALKATRDVIVDLSELRFAAPSLMVVLACLAQRL